MRPPRYELSENRALYVEAEGFVLVDEQRWPRALLALDELGMPSLRLFDGTSEQPRLLVGLGVGGTPTVSVHDHAGTLRASLTSPAGETRVTLYRADGGVVAELAVDAAGHSDLRRPKRRPLTG